MDLKLAFRTLLKEFTQETIQADFDKLPDGSKSKQMTRFYVEEILRVLAPGMVPDDSEDLVSANIDGKHDCGVDFLYRGDGRVLIIQAKYRAKGTAETPDQFNYFCDVLKRLHPKTGGGMSKNRKLLDGLGDIDWNSDTFELHYITLGKPGDTVREQERQGPAAVPGMTDFEDRVDLYLHDEITLNERLRESLSVGQAINEEVEVIFTPNRGAPPWLKLDDDRVSYLGRISASQLAELSIRHKYKLFAMNIRDYVGDTATNKEIIQTAFHNPHEFFFYNNGVSAVATAIKEDRDRDRLRCKNLSIINGAQTVRSLAKAHRKDPRAVRNVTVMFRISEFSLRLNVDEQRVLNNITRFNNTQNVVKVSDFRSNDPVQRNIARRFANVFRLGRPFWYKNKRSYDREGKGTPIGMEEFAKTIFAFKYGPDDMFGGTRYLFDIGVEGGYQKVFGDGSSVWMAIPEEHFQELAGIWFLCEQTRVTWKGEKERLSKEDANPEAGNALERRWMVFFTMGELLRTIYHEAGRRLDDDLRKLGKPKWTEHEGKEKEIVQRYTQIACKILVKIYKAAAPLPGFVHRNWFRETRTLDAIRSELQMIPLLGGPAALPLLRGRGKGAEVE